MPSIPRTVSPSRSLVSPFRALLALCAVGAIAIAAHAQTTPPAGGPVEGIKVHGHWTIDIRNADGTLASHHEFENALTSGGTFGLVEVLTGNQSPAAWTVVLFGASPGNDDPCEETFGRAPCYIRESAFNLTTASGSTNLQVTSYWITPDPTQPLTRYRGLRLSGSTVAASAAPSTLAKVDSGFKACAGGLTRAACVAAQGGLIELTSRILPSPIQIAAGQIIQVTVDITFS